MISKFDIPTFVLYLLLFLSLRFFVPEWPKLATVRKNRKIKNEHLTCWIIQVKYVFSDKTGTLTQNVMEYNQCSVGGTVYLATPSPGEVNTSMIQELESNGPNAPYIREFLTLLSVCHTVIPERDEASPDIIHYHAASPGKKIFKL